MAGIRLEFAQFGDFDSFDVLRSDTPMDINALPSPIVTGLTTMYYVDTSVVTLATYYYRAVVWRDGVSAVSGEISASAGKLWTPLQLTTAMYFDADNVTIDGSNRVSQVADLSGNARHAAQSNDTYKPIKSTFTGGQAAMQFDGTDDFLWINGSTYLNSVSGVWMFVVDLAGYKSGYTNIFGALYSGTGGGKALLYRNSGKILCGGRRTISDSYAEASDIADGSGSMTIGFGQLDYASAKAIIFKNGTQAAINNSFQAVGVADSANLSGSLIGATASNSSGSDYSEGYLGKIGCIIVGTGVLTSTDRQKLEGWAAWKYGLTDNLPSDHTYKTEPPLE